MHPSFPYESGRSRGGEYGSGVGGIRGRGDVLVQSHPGLEDSLVLHNALSSVVEEAQVSVALFLFLFKRSHGYYNVFDRFTSRVSHTGRHCRSQENRTIIFTYIVIYCIYIKRSVPQPFCLTCFDPD